MSESSTAEQSAVSVSWLCPLCQGGGTLFLEDAQGLRYGECGQCSLISLDPEQRPRLLDEVLRYGEHRNDVDDERYAAFLSRLGDPMAERLRQGATGLDFGSGPAPLLAKLMTDAGFPTDAYDPLFRPVHGLLDRRYDFVAASEVVEHLHAPDETFELFARLLQGGGLLGVMTRFHGLEAPFERWWYRRDPTHVCFYSEITMQWIADRYRWRLEVPRPHVAIFHVPPIA